MVIGMVTPRQIRAARALLGWSQQQLADKAIVSVSAPARLERGEVDPRMSTLMAVYRALTEAGIEFLPASPSACACCELEPGSIRSSHAAPQISVVFRFARDSLLEGGGFELSVPGDGQSRCSPFCAARLLGMDRRTGAGIPRFSSIIMRGKPSTMPPHTRG